ncbi:MAG: hypothetical protein ACTSX6_12030, partial [Candidatus Heimdallarchaeaceae archaeon]
MPKKKSVDDVDQDLKSLEKKVQILEKFINEEKKQKDIRVEKLEKTSEQLDNTTKSLKINIQSISKTVE